MSFPLPTLTLMTLFECASPHASHWQVSDVIDGVKSAAVAADVVVLAAAKSYADTAVS